MDTENHSPFPHMIFEKAGHQGQLFDVIAVAGTFDLRHGQPLLIADDPALDAYMADVHGKNFASHRDGGIELADWLASGDDALRLLVDRTLSRLYRSPEMATLYTTWFGAPGADALTFFRAVALPD